MLSKVLVIKGRVRIDRIRDVFQAPVPAADPIPFTTAHDTAVRHEAACWRASGKKPCGRCARLGLA